MKGIRGLETKDWTDWIAAGAKKIFHTEYFPRLKHLTPEKKTTKYCRFSTKALRDRLWGCLQYVTSVSVAAIFPTDASRSDIHLWNLIQQVGSTEMFHLPNRGCCFNSKTYLIQIQDHKHRKSTVNISYLVSVSLGIFVDFCQGQVGVEFISVFLPERYQHVWLHLKKNKNGPVIAGFCETK